MSEKSAEQRKMVVVTRCVDEAIRLGDDIVVRVEAIRRDKVFLEFEAPNTVPIHRLEVYEAIRRSFEG